MSFSIIEGDVFLYDADGNKLESVLDGSDYLLKTKAKALLYDSNGNAISSYDDSGTRRIETRTTVTGSLPTGTNTIGNVQLTDDGGTTIADLVTNNGIDRLENRSSVTSPDGSLDVAVVADNSINRLESRSSLVGQTAGSGSEKKVSVIDDVEDSSVKRLQTQALLAPGSTVNIGTSIPANPANLVITLLEKSGGGSDMLVDGSTAAVEFFYQAAAGKTIAIEALLFVFTADDFEFDGASFGPNTALANGFETRITISPSAETAIFNIKQNEDFLRVPGRVPVVNNTGPKDLLSAAFSFGGLVKLDGDSSDKISVYIRDDMTSVKFKYLTATLYGAEE